MKLRTLKDDSLLLLTAAIWGFAFVAQRVGMGFVEPFTYNGVRFALGALSLLPLVVLRGRGAGSDLRVPGGAQAPGGAQGGRRLSAGRGGLLLYGLSAGGVLFVAASLQQVGIVSTTAGKAGFITGLYVVLVPISGLFWGQRAGWGRWAGAALAASGLYLLSVTGRFSVARGDLLVLASAVFWTAHVQLIGLAAPRVDSLELAALQFAVCSVLSMAVALLTESVQLAGILAAAVPILYGGLGSVGVAYTLQVVVQKTAHPAHAAILLSLEGVFAVLGGRLILGESLSARGLAGCLLMLAGMLASQSTLLADPPAAPKAAASAAPARRRSRRGPDEPRRGES